MAPSLSELKAKLRQGGSAPAKGSVAKAPPSADGLKRGPSTEDGLDASAPKKPKVSIVKTPAGGLARGKSAPGLSAKVSSPGSATPPPSSPLPGDFVDANAVVSSTTAMKSSGAVFQKASIAKVAPVPSKKLGGAPPPMRPAEPFLAPQRPPPRAAMDGDLAALPFADGAVSPMAIEDLVSTMEASPSSAKQKYAVQLAEAIGGTLQIEHINHFLRALKQKIQQRAQANGIQAHASQAPKALAAPSPSEAAAMNLAVPKSAAVAKPAVAKVMVTKAAASKAAASKSAAIAKVPPPGGATPPPKAAVTKAVVKVPTAAKASKAPVKAPAATPESPADAAESQPAASPPASPPADDALYQLVGDLAEAPVVQDGMLLENRLLEVFKRLWDGVARKHKDWIAAWQSMGIPVDRQVEALQKFLNFAWVKTEDPEKAPAIIAELVKAHKIKMRSVEEVLINFGHNLDGILAMNEEAWQVYAKILVHVFPKPAVAGWGWSRVGWSWQSWWQFAERCIQTLEPSRAFDVLGLILRLIQDREGQPLPQVQAWLDGDRFAKVLAKLCELGACEQPEVIERLSLLGVIATEDGGQEQA
eukprot:gb/GFBE01081285.1/.p1 GENE.gb/GFBE01081285.1/~~gb/GFBE01081285.1/.p1  ORF type:complete len:588 (+),score=147.05 gb/GFBE01081285.1/:1-1764(+)